MDKTLGMAAREIMTEALRCSGGAPVALLIGSASSLDEDPVKLGVTTTSDCHVEIPRDAIYHSSPGDGGNVRLFINRDAALVLTRRETIRAGDIVGGDPGIGVAEMMNLASVIKGWAAAGMRAISQTAECLAMRKEYDELEEMVEDMRKRGDNKERRLLFEEALLRMLVDMQDCPDWIHPFGTP